MAVYGSVWQLWEWYNINMDSCPHRAAFAFITIHCGLVHRTYCQGWEAVDVKEGYTPYYLKIGG